MSENKLQITETVKNAIRKSKKARSWNPLLEIENLTELIPHIPAHDLYVIIKRTGLQDSLEILEVASTEQIQAFIDFDCWNKDNLLLVNLLDWIQVLVHLEPEKFGKIFEQLDQEVPALFFHESVHIFNLKEGEAPDWGNYPYYTTPDTFFELRPKNAADDDIWKGVIATVERLYMYDIVFAQKVLLDAMWDTRTNLLEGAYKWMTGRLMDQGFWDYLSAMEVYKFIDPSSIKITEKSGEHIPETPSLLPVKEENILKGTLKEVLDKLDEANRERVETGLIYLINKMAAADRVSVEDDDELKQIAELAYGSLNIGMSYIAKNNKADFVKVLENVAVSRIFRAGYSLILQLKGLARTLSRSGHISLTPRTHTLLEGDWLNFYLSLTDAHPRFFNISAGQKTDKVFETLEEVALAGNLVEELSAMKGIIFRILGIDPSLLTKDGIRKTTRKSEAEVTFGDLWRSAAVSLLLYGDFSHVPLSAAKMEELENTLKNTNKSEFISKTVSSVMNLMKEHKIEGNLNMNRIVSSFLNPLFDEKSDIPSILLIES